MKQSKVITPSILYYGTSVVLITTRNLDGTTNISPMSSSWALGERVILGLARTGQAYINIERERECVINLPSADLWPKVESIAPTTGRNPVPGYKQEMGYYYAKDKFALAGLTAVDSEVVKPPRIAECPLQLEAKVLAMHPFSAETTDEDVDECSMIETKIKRVHAHEDIVVDGTNHIDINKWSPLFFVFRHYFGHAEHLARYFRAEA